MIKNDERHFATRNPEKFNDAKKYTSGLLSDAISACRHLSHELMPTLLAEFGLDVAIRDFISSAADEGTSVEVKLPLTANDAN